MDDRDYREAHSIAHNAKPFNVYNKYTGEYIGQWRSQSLCAEDLDINRICILRCLNNDSDYTNDYIFIYTEEDNLNVLAFKLDIVRQKDKTFNVYDKNNNYIMTSNNQKECAEILSLNKSHISNCLLGRAKTHKGYKFYYVNNDPNLLL